MRTANIPLLKKYMAEYDKAYEHYVQEELDRLGVNKSPIDEQGELALERAKDQAKEWKIKNRRAYHYTVVRAIEAAEEGRQFPMFPIDKSEVK